MCDKRVRSSPSSSLFSSFVSSEEKRLYIYFYVLVKVFIGELTIFKGSKQKTEGGLFKWFNGNIIDSPETIKKTERKDLAKKEIKKRERTN